MSTDEIIAYVLKSPENTNPNVLRTMVNAVEGDKLPPIEEGDAGKVLTVKDDESGTTWSEVKSDDSLLMGKMYITPKTATSVDAGQYITFSVNEDNVNLIIVDAQSQSLNSDSIDIKFAACSSFGSSTWAEKSIYVNFVSPGYASKEPAISLSNKGSQSLSLSTSNPLITYTIFYTIKST